MDRWDDGFFQEVFSHLPRATKKERAALRKELGDHLEDAADAIETRGHSEEEARSRAVEAMGDPAEIGRALNAQLSPFWLWLGRVSKAATICLLCLLANSLYMSRGGLRELSPTPDWAQSPPPLEGYLCREANIQLKADMVKLQIYRTELSPDGTELVLDCAVWVTESDRYNREELGALLETRPPNRAWYTLYGTGGRLGRETNYIGVTVPVTPGQSSVELRFYRQMGRMEQIEMPIDWGEWDEANLDP